MKLNSMGETIKEYNHDKLEFLNEFAQDLVKAADSMSAGKLVIRRENEIELMIESHCYREKMSSMEAKSGIIREAVRGYLSNPLYSSTPTA